MDPKQQPQRPQPGAPYISDFVGSARPQSNPAQPQQPQPPVGQPASAPTSPSLINSRPSTDVTPRSISTNQQPTSQQDQDQITGQPTRRSSFELPETPKISPNADKLKKPHQGLRDILSIFGVLGSALVLAFCLITFVFQSYQVDGPSMQTTLQNNDHLIVWKVAKTISNITRHHYIPNRGDVIVFNEQTADSGTGEKQLIKRVIGLPGERVVVKNGQITVYNKEFPNGFSPDKTLPYGKVIVTTPGNVDITLGEDEVYVCGDNRTNSLDSRVFGPIKSKQIVGKLVLRVLPLNTVTKF
jgi:signal peptidase I